MAGIAQTASEQAAGGDGLRCRKCGAGNPKHSVFCNACGYYLKKRISAALLVLLTAATAITASLLLGFKEEWFLIFLASLYVGFRGLGGILRAFFGLSSKHYWQWKTRMQRKRELKEQRSL